MLKISLKAEIIPWSSSELATNSGNLFFRIAEIIEARKPKALLLENVKNLKNHDNGNTFRVIEDTLTKLGYHIKTEVLNSMTHGNMPQNRERIFIVGFLDESKRDKFEFPGMKILQFAFGLSLTTCLIFPFFSFLLVWGFESKIFFTGPIYGFPILSENVISHFS